FISQNYFSNGVNLSQKDLGIYNVFTGEIDVEFEIDVFCVVELCILILTIRLSMSVVALEISSKGCSIVKAPKSSSM
ncbi:1996_t:CDS:2, partial [Funneliformis geosporum]